MENYTGQVSLQKDDRILDPSDPLGYSDLNTADATTIITVRDSVGDTISTIFSDNESTPLTNPFNTSAVGKFTFYAANANYNVIVNEGLATEASINDIQLFDPTTNTENIATNTGNITTNTNDITILQTVSALPQTVSGLLTTGGKENQLRDSGVFTMPLANSVAANVILVVNLPDTYAAQVPTLTRTGADLFEDNAGTDTSITWAGAARLTLTSDGVSKWSL